MSLVKSIRKYMTTCPHLDPGVAINIDHIANQISYAITFLPANPVVEEYITGDKLKQKQFIIVARYLTALGKDYIDNQELLEKIQSWFETQNDNGNFPTDLEENQTPESIEITSAGYLSAQSESGEDAEYQITCVFTYKEGEV